MAGSILPSSGLGVRALLAAGRLISVLPSPIGRALARLDDRGVRFFDSIRIPDYPALATR
jgi:hypothetical protein